ncbi:MAG: kelch repeat-containing protein [Planctomycetota bacterium]
MAVWVCLLATGGELVAQAPTWLQRVFPDGTMLVDDPSRGRVVLFGLGAQTWEWDGRSWTLRSDVPGVGFGFGIAAAYHAGTKAIYVFGGQASGVSNEMWRYDGRTWSQVSGAMPPPRRNAAMAYDSTRDKLVLFGGSARGRGLDDTWEWDGVSWTQIVTTTSPPAIENLAMTYDAARREMVLLTSATPRTCPTYTWTWDGVTWSRLNVANSPPVSESYGLTYDTRRQRVVLTGGLSCSGWIWPSETWEWDGARWLRVSTTDGPSNITWSERHGYVISIDRVTGDTATWDGSAWSRIPGPIGPASTFSVTYDAARQRVVAYQTAISEWDGTTWRTIYASPSPDADFSDIVHDAARGNNLLFSGDEFGRGPTYGTWTWDGTSWTEHRPSVQPVGRVSHAMACDSRRSRIVMFGGDGYDDTWEWDGSLWIERMPSRRPSGRSGHRMAYDPSRGRVVLYGGIGPFGGASEETWEWDGTNWTQLRPPQTPGPRHSFTMAYDPLIQRIVLAGGNATGDSWQWDGANWSPLATTGQAPEWGAMTWDDARQEMVMVTSQWPRMRVLRTTIPASTQAYGSGCASSGALSLAAFGQPTLGNASFAVDLDGAAPFAPAAVLVSTSPASVAVGPCLILVGLGHGAALLTRTNARGFATAALPVPSTASVLGAQAFTQGWVLDPTSPLLVANTAGVALVFGE